MSDLFEKRFTAALVAYADQRDIYVIKGSSEWHAVRAALAAAYAVEGVAVVPERELYGSVADLADRLNKALIVGCESFPIRRTEMKQVAEVLWSARPKAD